MTLRSDLVSPRRCRDVGDSRTRRMCRRDRSSVRVRRLDLALKYYDLGVTRFLIRGFDPLGDVRDWGAELVPALREGARLRDEARAAENAEGRLTGSRILSPES